VSRDVFLKQVEDVLEQVQQDGLFKRERLIESAQDASVPVVDPSGRSAQLINLCANNYLGLANDPALVAASKKALDEFGYGMSSVRFICGTQTQHRKLETKIADWLGFDDSILYAACFDANGGLFEPLLTAEDAIVSDSLNHASIIDGIRLCKAKRYRYANNDMTDLETKLKQARSDNARHIMIATDGVFSMDGVIANLAGVCDLADKYGALVMVDDCHATGFLGPGGRGTAAHCGVEGRIDLLTSTLGKALGGAMGGFTCAKQSVIELLRQRSRPYLFSNSLAPPLVGGSLAAIDLVAEADGLRQRLFQLTDRFRQKMVAAGFTVNGSDHPIVPVMLGDAKLAQKMSARLLEHGVYAIGFFFPVVPNGTARIRTQMNAALTDEQLDQAIQAFVAVGRELGVIQ
jgi:glycine C-acetyltransferase